MAITNLILVSLLLSSQIEFHLGHCKTLSSTRTPSSDVLVGEKYGRGLDNFVDFTDEGDQLAVESSGIATGSFGGKKSDTKRQILGKGSSSARKCQETGLQCPNVHKALYPVIPVIIAALIGLIGSIIIANIFRLVFKLMNENQDMEAGYDEAGYDYRRQLSGYRLFGYDLNNINYTRILKNVLTAIDKVY